MISKSKPANRIRKEWVVADIENRSDGSLIAIETYDGTNKKIHFDWDSWLYYVVEMAKDDKSYRTIYAHNGGAWDWLSFIEWIIKSRPSLTFNTIENGGRLVALFVKIQGLTIRLCDSIFLLQSKLEDAAQTYIKKGKVKIKHLPEWYWDNDRDTFWEYLHEDCVTLHETLLAFADTIYSKIAPIGSMGLTLPSTSMKCFRTSYLDREIEIPQSEDLKSMLREGYTGGRVEVFKPGYFPNVYVYDFNSLYPSVMMDTPVPVTGDAFYSDTFDPDSCGVWDIDFEQKDTSKLPLLMVKGEGVYSGSGVYFTNEINTLIQHARGKVKVNGGYAFRESEVLFRSYIDKLYTLRMTDRSGPIGNLCKLMMNSLYGRFGIKPERTSTHLVDMDALDSILEKGHHVECLNAEIGLYSITEETVQHGEHVGIAGTITSEARSRLWRSFNTGTVYCDTDSVHTTNPIPSNASKLGSLKEEYVGEGVYLGRKLYALNNEKSSKVRVKGVRVKKDDDDELGFPLDFHGLKAIVDCGSIECVFRSAPTKNRVLQGGKSCTFNPKIEKTTKRKRTIRRTA